MLSQIGVWSNEIDSIVAAAVVVTAVFALAFAAAIVSIAIVRMGRNWSRSSSLVHFRHFILVKCVV